MFGHRICTAGFAETAEAAFSGQGGLYGSGRWHQRGRMIVYTAAHRSLAILEIMVHLDTNWPLQPMVAWKIDVPEEFITTPDDLPVDWKTNLDATRTYGDEWLAQKRSVAMRVPSVIVPSELNVLLNPTHPDFSLTWVKEGPIAVEIDPRLL